LPLTIDAATESATASKVIAADGPTDHLSSKIIPFPRGA
jgi:hypothetical protein